MSKFLLTNMEITQNKCRLNTLLDQNCIKIRQNGQVQKDVQTRQTFDFGMEPKITTLLPTSF